MIDDGDYERLKAAIPRHTRDDGTVNFATLAKELGAGHRTTMMRRVAMLAASGALGTKSANEKKYDLLSRSDAAKALGLSEHVIGALIHTGELEAVSSGRLAKITANSVADLADAMLKAPALWAAAERSKQDGRAA